MRLFRRVFSLILITSMLFSLSCEAFASTLTLPAALEVIGDEAFYGDESLDEVVVPYGATTIGPLAFAYSGLKQITIPDTVTEIAADAFEGTEGLSIISSAGSYAREYADRYSLPWEYDNAYYANEKTDSMLAFMNNLEEIQSLRYEHPDFTPISTEGLTDASTIEFIEQYNHSLLEQKADYGNILTCIDEISAQFNSFGEDIQANGFQASEDGITIRNSDFSFSVSNSFPDILGEDHRIVSSEVLDDGSVMLEVSSGSETYYIAVNEDGVTQLSSFEDTAQPTPDGDSPLSLNTTGETYYLTADASGITLSTPFGDMASFSADDESPFSLHAVMDYLIERANAIQNWIAGIQPIVTIWLNTNDMLLQAANEWHSESLRKLNNAMDLKSKESLEKLVNQSYANVEEYTRNVRILRGIASALAGINAVLTTGDFIQTYDKFRTLETIREHGHPIWSELRDSEKMMFAEELNDHIRTAQEYYVSHCCTSLTSFICDLVTIGVTFTAVVPGANVVSVPVLAASITVNIVSSIVNVCSGYLADLHYNLVLSIDRKLHGGIFGLVKDTDGKAIPGVRVIVDGFMESQTGEDGTYLLFIPVGSYTIRYEKSGYYSQTRPILTRDGDITAMEDIILDKFPLSNALYGTISDSTINQPVPGVSVTLDKKQTVIADSSGQYAFPDVNPGTHSLHFSTSGYLDKDLTITVTESKREFNTWMTPHLVRHTITGRITDSKTGEALEGVLVTLNGSTKTGTDTNGSYSITAYTGSKCTLTFENTGYIMISASLELPQSGGTEYNGDMVKILDETIPEDHFDPAFLAWCIERFDTEDTKNPVLGWVKDGKLSRKEILAVHNIYCNNYGFTSLKGIQEFSNLEHLECSYNKLITLDVSGLRKLQYLSCSKNDLQELNASGCSKLSTLDVKQYSLKNLNLSNCSSLTKLDCSSGDLRNLNVSGCSSLSDLNCDGNYLTSLDLSSCRSLTKLDCYSNYLTSLDLSNCTALTELDCGGNELTNLRASGYSTLTHLSCTSNPLTSLDLSGFTALQTLDCRWCHQLKHLNISGCSALTDFHLACESDEILTTFDASGCSALTYLGVSAKSMDVSGCKNLEELDCMSSYMTHLNVSGCSALQILRCYRNQLTNLDLSSCSKLKELDCEENQLTSLDLSKCIALEIIACWDNQLTRLDVSACKALTSLACDSNRLTALDVSGSTMLEYLSCSSNLLTTLDVSACKALKNLNCYSNRLTALDVSENTMLEYLSCGENQLTSLDLSNCMALKTIQCDENQLTSLDLSGCGALNHLACNENQLTSLDLSGYYALQKLWCENNALISLNVSNDTALDSLFCYGNPLTELVAINCPSLSNDRIFCEPSVPIIRTEGIRLTAANFPDNAFRAYISQSDLNRSGTLSDSEIALIKTIDCQSRGISSLKGIEHLYAATNINCSNNMLTELDLSGLSALESVTCNNNPLTMLNLSGCTNLTHLNVSDNPLESLNVSGCTGLSELWIGGMPLTSLNASGCTGLTVLPTGGMQLTYLNVSGCTQLEELDCNNQQLTYLNVSGCSALTYLQCAQNHLTSLALTGCSALRELRCNNNPISSLDLSGCSALLRLSCANMPLTVLDLSACSALVRIAAQGLQITVLDTSACRNLNELHCQGNYLMTRLDVSNHPELTVLNCGDNAQLAEIVAVNCPKLTAENILCDAGVIITR